MLEKFQFQLTQLGIKPTDKVLLAISGGVDSMVLWDLFEQTPTNYGVAHVNFSLRAGESDADEKLVVDHAQYLRKQCFVLKENTRAYAEQEGLSIQMAAREIRYKWFEKLMKEQEYDYLSTAHHLEDRIETFFINLNRGTGIKGLVSLKSTATIVRPFLNFSKQEIRAYAKERQVVFREDFSNSSTKYERNWFRHTLVKPWIAYNENLLPTMSTNLNRLEESQAIVEVYLKTQTEDLRREIKNGFMSIQKVLSFSFVSRCLYYLLSPMGFNETQLNDFEECLRQGKVGKKFLSQTHELYVDRNKIYIVKRAEKQQQKFLINQNETELDSPIKLNIQRVDKSQYQIVRNKLSAGFDEAKLTFPLKLRVWENGDRMTPLGMKGKKKISDILTDDKIPLNKKQQSYVLITAKDEIIWLVGMRMDDRFRITDETEKVFSITINEEK